jgi:hypothetical protein
MTWASFDGGTTVSQTGSEDGVITLDEEHVDGVRITLESGCGHAPFAITCGIYGWMFHTRYLGTESEAMAEFHRMKNGLVEILGIVPRADDPEVDAKRRIVGDAIGSFVERFP